MKPKMNGITVLKEFLTYYGELITLTKMHECQHGRFTHGDYKLRVCAQDSTPYRNQTIVGLSVEVTNIMTDEIAVVRITGSRITGSPTTLWNDAYLMEG